MNESQGSNWLPFLLIGMFLLFLALKLCEVITWSWWWVTAPLWIPVAAVAIVLIAVTILLKLLDKD
jgi:hypothetical protein